MKTLAKNTSGWGLSMAVGATCLFTALAAGPVNADECQRECYNNAITLCNEGFKDDTNTFYAAGGDFNLCLVGAISESCDARISLYKPEMRWNGVFQVDFEPLNTNMACVVMLEYRE